MTEQKHTCISVAEGCRKSTMSTWKSKKVGKKITCSACSTNATKGRPQHG